MIWLGADPGGNKAFGVARLLDDGSFQTSVVSYAEEALDWFCKQDSFEPRAAGIDAPLWWSSGKSSDRKADQVLRREYKIHPGTVQTANSLQGAALIQGVMLANRLREQYPDISITEAHPKALLRALKLKTWDEISGFFSLLGKEPKEEHERDALLGAVAAREGALKRWSRNLAADRLQYEQNPETIPAGPVFYWWPDT
jgi:predicted nuclease with RNAse H fold